MLAGLMESTIGRQGLGSECLKYQYKDTVAQVCSCFDLGTSTPEANFLLDVNFVLLAIYRHMDKKKKKKLHLLAKTNGLQECK